MNITRKSAIRKNRDPQGKPLEDYIIADDRHGIYIVCDGVTRTVLGGAYPQDSPAAAAAQLFAETAHASLVRSLPTAEPTVALYQAAVVGNAAIAQYNRERFAVTDYLEHDLASTVAIWGVVAAGAFHFAAVGDCLGYLVGMGEATEIAHAQTAALHAYYRAIAPAQRAALNARRDFRNNKQSPYGYGVFTGEPSALAFVEVQTIPIVAGQRIVLASDGLLDLFQAIPTSIFEPAPEAMIAAAEALEEERQLRSDDKAVILLQA